MIDLFQILNKEESTLLVDAIPLITILIAGADGQIDNKEKEWGAKLTKIRSYAHAELLNDYYKKVGEIYSGRLEALINELPDDTKQRTAIISERLAGINPVIAKLNPENAYTIYSSLTSFAEHVAKASGGFLRIGAISKAEKDLMGLPMLTVIEKPEEEEDEA